MPLISDLFRDAVLKHARLTLGIRETSKNSGPLIDDWLAAVGQKPGVPWCAAYTHGVFDRAASDIGVPNPHPATASSRRVWERVAESLRRPLPASGDLYVLDHGGGRGHIGIIETVSPDGQTVTDISGNSNEIGEREGTSVVRHTWKPRDGKRGRLLGWIDLCAAVLSPGADDNGLPPSPFS